MWLLRELFYRIGHAKLQRKENKAKTKQLINDCTTGKNYKCRFNHCFQLLLVSVGNMEVL
ncbi:hypothetical protein AN959_09995 [Psychrobacillus sp. FJAT-21963]|nr:hypothetical protein AN959_09995 [Psychrobacillus sp. FJAT-21963]